MIDGIVLENGIEWWLSEDKTTWYSRKQGTEDWAADPSGNGPRSSRVVTKLEDLEDRFEVIESVTTADGTKVEVIGYPALLGSSDARTAEALFYTHQSGAKLKMVRITLSDSKVRVEPGALYFMKGDLAMQVSSGGGFFKGLKRKFFSGETFFVNEIHGTGEIYLEPTFGHFILHTIKGQGHGVICDKGMFYAGAGDLKVGAKMQGTLSAGLMGGEGLFQSHITGSGVAVLYSPVPKEEIMKHQLVGSKLFVDGNFALLRTEEIVFKVERSSKKLIGSAVSGEGLLQTFSGTGEVWIAPTQGVYEKLATPKGAANFAENPTSMGTMIKSGFKKRS